MCDLKKSINEVISFSAEKENNNRSSKRTDILHLNLIKMIIESNDVKKYNIIEKSKKNKASIQFGEYKVVFEDKIKDYYGTFNVDAVLYRNDVIISVYLFKFYEKSILKNTNNNSNTLFGEITRLTGGINYIENPHNIIFIDILPKKTYTVLKDSGKFVDELTYDGYEKIRNKKLKEHPLFKDIKVFDYKIWFEPNDNFFSYLKGEKGNYTDFIKSIDEFDFKKVPFI